MKKLVYIEITNTLAAKSVSGIQRVTRELIIHLSRQYFTVQLLIYCARCKSYRIADENEVNSIQNYKIGENSFFKNAQNYLSKKAGLHDCLNKIQIADLEPNSVFLELEAAWHNPYNRNELLANLLKSGITTIQLHYDLIPILFPDFTPDSTKLKFGEYMKAHFKYTNHFICISVSSKQALKNYLVSNNIFENQKITSFQLGSNFNDNNQHSGKELKHKFFILAVGTIEVRKNRMILLKCFDKLRDEFPDLELVLVGKKGWKVEETMQQIKKHPDYNKRLFWYDSLDDQNLTSLYKNAFLLVEPSFYEGYGLPIAEALKNQCVVLSSDKGALPEAGGEYAVYFDLEDEDSLYILLKKCILDIEYYNSIKDGLKSYKGISWQESANQFSDTLIKMTEI